MRTAGAMFVVALCPALLCGCQQHATRKPGGHVKITVTSVFVDDQDKALKFYTDVLGFVKKDEIPLGEYKWLTVVSADDPDGVQLLLEPNVNPAAKTYQAAIFEQGIPAASFGVDDIHSEYERMHKLGVEFTMKPTEHGTVIMAIFNDTCGNRIQIVQQVSEDK